MSRTRRLLDQLTEATVVLSYGSTGYALRRRGWSEGETDVDLTNRVAIVTGANAGLGYEVTRELAARGATVAMVCRSEERGRAAQSRIQETTGNSRVDLFLADLGELAQVRQLAADLRQRYERVDRLVLNAGVLLDALERTAEGLERAFATNLLSGFLLQSLLHDALVAGAPARVLHVSSGGMYTQRLDLEVLQGNVRRYDGVVAYAQTKRAQVILNELWAERLRNSGIVSHAMHPGWADTPGVRRSLPRFRALMRPVLRDAHQGADTLVWLATAEEPGRTSGGFWFDRELRRTHLRAATRSTDDERHALWRLCSDLTAT
jgi:NAD(P)-dependent dehydrogenase (short-subunit alcohol dehydrogenase family)